MTDRCPPPLVSPSATPAAELLLGCTATTVRRSTLSPSCPLSPLCCCVHSALRVATLQPLSSYAPVVATPPTLLARPTRAFAPVKEKTGAAQEERVAGGGSEERGRGGEERKREKVEGKRGAYEQAKTQLLFFPLRDFGEFSRRRYYALFFLLPFVFQSRLLFPSSLSSSLLSSPPRDSVSYSILNLVCSLRTRRRGGRAVTSLADFRLKCSHLESVFSCTEPVDIFSQRTSSFPGIFRGFQTSPKFSFLLLESVLGNRCRSIVPYFSSLYISRVLLGFAKIWNANRQLF